MKKLKNILLAFTMLFVVVLTTACSDGTKKRVFVKDVDGQKTTITYVYNEKEDRVLKQLTTNEGIYDKLNPPMTKEEVKKIIDKDIEETKEIKGKEETEVLITVIRDGKELTFKVIRKEIKVDSTIHKLLDNGIGYLDLKSFSEESDKDKETA